MQLADYEGKKLVTIRLRITVFDEVFVVCGDENLRQRYVLYTKCSPVISNLQQAEGVTYFIMPASVPITLTLSGS